MAYAQPPRRLFVELNVVGVKLRCRRGGRLFPVGVVFFLQSIAASVLLWSEASSPPADQCSA